MKNYEVGVASTCSGAWPVIFERHIDEQGSEWKREVAVLPSVFSETEAHLGSGKAAIWNDDPTAFERRDDYDEIVAEAYILAAAPQMQRVLSAVVRSKSASTDLKRLAREALSATVPPDDLPREEV